MNGTAAEQRERELAREERANRDLAIAAALIEANVELARGGDEDALAWMHSERFEQCWKLIDAEPRDPAEARAGLLDADDETDPDEPVGNALRDPIAMGQMIGAGLSQRDIARHLGVSRATVKHWLARHRIASTQRNRRAAHAA